MSMRRGLESKVGVGLGGPITHMTLPTPYSAAHARGRFPLLPTASPHLLPGYMVSLHLSARQILFDEAHKSLAYLGLLILSGFELSAILVLWRLVVDGIGRSALLLDDEARFVDELLWQLEAHTSGHRCNLVY